jgi:uncharacterized protein Yka (UPF0111/DUF47 family)
VVTRTPARRNRTGQKRSASHSFPACNDCRLSQPLSGCLRNLDPAFEEHAVEVNRLENVADVLLRRSVAELFETLRDPVEVLKWKEIYETLEAVTDRCEDVTDVVEGLILKQA